MMLCYAFRKIAFEKQGATPPRETAKALYVLLAVLQVVLGCEAASPVKTPPDDQSQTNSDEHQGSIVRDAWAAIYLQGAKVGWQRQWVEKIEHAEGPRFRTRQILQLKIERFNQAVTNEIRLSTLETADHRLLTFDQQTQLGSTPKRVAGRVEADRLVLARHQADNAQTVEAPWPEGARGYFGVEQSLLAEPLQPGQTRELQVLSPLLDRVIQVRLEAERHEVTQLLAGSFKLLKIRQRETLPDGQHFDSTLWCNEAGEVLRARAELLGQEIYRTSQALAQQPDAAGSLDLGLDMIVRLDRPVPEVNTSRQAVYRVQLPQGNPAEVFPAGPGQTVSPAGPHAARLVIEPIFDPETDSKTSTVLAEPDTLAASDLVEKDDPEVQKLAHSVLPGSHDRLAIALALEKLVHRHITQKDFSQVFASAAEVCRSQQGDCTEHAVLLAAVCRARGLPARVAMGLVYDAKAGGFAYHMWTEVQPGSRWRALDATRGIGRLTVGHLKLADSNLQGSSAYSSFLPILQVLGKLEIELLQVE